MINFAHIIMRFIFAQFHTYNGEVERGLLGAKFILELQRVAATVILFTRCDCQLTAVLCSLYGNAPTSCLDLNRRNIVKRMKLKR